MPASFHTDAAPPDDGVIEPWFDDPIPDFDIEPVMAYVNDSDFAA